MCGSGLQAVNSAAHAIASDCGDIFIAGGVESMTRAPYVMPKPEAEFARAPQLFDTTLGARMYNPKLTAKGYPPISMGETAENVAERYKISRVEQDEFAYASQHKTGEAQRSGAFSAELLGVQVPGNGKAAPAQTVIVDEHPRPEVTMEQLAKLKPAFREGGTVTAGNSSGINDGAAGIVMMSADEAKRRGLKPMARIVTSAVAGVDPNFMGLGPIPASRRRSRARNCASTTSISSSSTRPSLRSRWPAFASLRSTHGARQRQWRRDRARPSAGLQRGAYPRHFVARDDGAGRQRDLRPCASASAKASPRSSNACRRWTFVARDH